MCPLTVELEAELMYGRVKRDRVLVDASFFDIDVGEE